MPTRARASSAIYRRPPSRPLPEPTQPPTPPPGAPRHLGELARELREAAGLTRKQLATDTGLSDMTILNFEFSRRLPTKDTLDRLLAHPALTQLIVVALNEGIAVELRPELPVAVDVVAILIRRRP